jgi:transcription termination factor NusB
VAINEAVEIAKEYSGDDAFRFVNGVLDGVWREVGRSA